MHDAQMHGDRNSFITLTYDDKHLPENGQLVLEHWQKFAKRLRKNHGPFRFYMCGEYGERTHRPHFHACIMGHSFIEDRFEVGASRKGPYPLYQSPTLSKSWKLGRHWIGELNQETARYVSGYVTKKITGDRAQLHYERLNTETGEIFQQNPEFATMSRRPGLGKTWIQKIHGRRVPLRRGGRLWGADQAAQIL